MAHDGSAKAKRLQTCLRGRTLAPPSFQQRGKAGVQARITDTLFFG